MIYRFSALFALLAPIVAQADAPEVVDATARESGSGWQISVTIRHPDTGWDHYADGWEVLDTDGNRLGFRELLHPHETEQPFTRSLGGVAIPDGAESVEIRARCSVDGGNDATYTLRLPN